MGGVSGSEGDPETAPCAYLRLSFVGFLLPPTYHSRACWRRDWVGVSPACRGCAARRTAARSQIANAPDPLFVSCTCKQSGLIVCVSEQTLGSGSSVALGGKLSIANRADGATGDEAGLSSGGC